MGLTFLRFRSYCAYFAGIDMDGWMDGCAPFAKFDSVPLAHNRSPLNVEKWKLSSEDCQLERLFQTSLAYQKPKLNAISSYSRASKSKWSMMKSCPHRRAWHSSSLIYTFHTCRL